jgi:hypothetical protein
MRQSSRSLPTPVVALAIGGGLALAAMLAGSCLLFGVLFLGVLNGGFPETGLRVASADVDSPEDDDDAVDEPPDAMADEEPAQPQDFPPIMQRLGPPAGPTPKGPVGPINDGRWRADLNTRKIAEARLFVLADQVEYRMSQLTAARGSGKADEQRKATQELKKARRLMAAEDENVNAMAWTPVNARSDADLRAERSALVDDVPTFAKWPGSEFSKQFKDRAAGQRRARVEELDAVLGN